MIRKEDHAYSEVEASVDAETLAGGTLPARPMPANFLYRIRRVLRVLGPGLVTGAADDDPSGIATYSQVGAQFGFSMLWTMLFIFPFMAAMISARLGRITGRGIAGNIRCFYSSWLLYGIVALLLFANIVNMGADIGAMGAAANLLVGGPTLLYSSRLDRSRAKAVKSSRKRFLEGPSIVLGVSFVGLFLIISKA